MQNKPWCAYVVPVAHHGDILLFYFIFSVRPGLVGRFLRTEALLKIFVKQVFLERIS